jgi:hypothetical protein
VTGPGGALAGPVVRPGDLVTTPTHEAPPAGPNVARIHDILLGGKNGRAADELAAGELVKLIPDAVMAAYQNQSFVRRAVRFLAGQANVRQFIAVRSGFAASHDICHIVQSAAPGARVVYLDDDRGVSTGHEPLARDGQAVTIRGNLRNPGRGIADPALRTVVNLEEPVAVFLIGVLHFIEDDRDASRLVGTFVRSLAPGSYLVVSHATGDDLPNDLLRSVRELYQKAGAPLTPRSRRRIAGLLDELELIPPAVVNGSAWRPGHAATKPRRTLFYAAVGRKDPGHQSPLGPRPRLRELGPLRPG